MSSGIRIVPPVEGSGTSFLGALYSFFTGGWEGILSSLVNNGPKFSPLDALPCANINVEKHAICDKPGKLACSSCKLVSYCSKECQKAHWGTHKPDCKDSIRSNSWKPGWVIEGRKPDFIDESGASTGEEFASLYRERLSIGSSLWGNIPAMDIVNLANNEKDLERDFSLAFAASGDIRNIVSTINALGSDYSGRLDVLLNDVNPHVVSRNIALLLILGTIPDEIIAADMALHFWYSVFMPMEYRLRILSMVSDLLKNNNPEGPIVVSLGPHSTMTCLVTPNVLKLLMENAGPTISPEQAQKEYERVRQAPSRADFRDRMYMGLKPSHRLAFLEYRRFGIILPFGALNAHCNVPNPSLFSNGVWLSTDYADPLGSWDVDEVLNAGKAHGAQPEDVYGCLYFFLTDQLRAFSQHIRQHHISFRIFSFEACALAQGISQGEFAECSVPPTTRFDRIDVSNIMDPNYAGIRDVINAWGPLLAKSKNSALTGYFMNWVAFGAKGRVVDAGPLALRSTMNSLMSSGRIQSFARDPVTATYFTMKAIETFYDNSKAFSKFWRDHGGTNVNLRLRSAHKILPHRLRATTDAKPDALPNFANDEEWYRHIHLTSYTWTERFVELSHSKA